MGRDSHAAFSEPSHDSFGRSVRKNRNRRRSRRNGIATTQRKRKETINRTSSSVSSFPINLLFHVLLSFCSFSSPSQATGSSWIIFLPFSYSFFAAPLFPSLFLFLPCSFFLSLSSVFHTPSLCLSLCPSFLPLSSVTTVSWLFANYISTLVCVFRILSLLLLLRLSTLFVRSLTHFLKTELSPCLPSILLHHRLC